MSLDYKVRDPQIEQRLESIGKVLQSAMKGTGYGFCLLMFTLGKGGNMFYLCNAKREDMIRAMDEFKQKFREN